MAGQQGSFIWYELMTTDRAAAAAFYGKVLGWSVSHLDDGHRYSEIRAPDGGAVGGMLPLDADMLAHGAKPGWFAYLNVDDVGAQLDAFKAAGGHVFMDQTLPVGRMALVADPQGVPLYLMTPVPPPDQPDAVSTAFNATAEGHVTWNELIARDAAEAEAFYASRFGWTRLGTMPMGPMGDYVFLAAGDQRFGALMQAPDGTQPQWKIYWRTGNIDAAAARIAEAGGTVTNQPHEVPGGDWVVQALDPEGVFLGVVGSR
jgi:predicted enzyme related to lactoylglutathione lyase